MMIELNDSDVGFLFRCYWAKGGGARSSKATHKRLLEAGLIIEKGMNYSTINEEIHGPRYNITEFGKNYLKTGTV